jgi:hypothetical protein
MNGMARRRRALVSALLAALVVVAALPVPCACQPRAAAASEHGCCAPLTSVRAAEPGCCAAFGTAPDTAATAPTASAAIAPTHAALVWAAPALPTLERGPSPLEPLVSPPLTVRRL